METHLPLLFFFLLKIKAKGLGHNSMYFKEEKKTFEMWTKKANRIQTQFKTNKIIGRYKKITITKDFKDKKENMNQKNISIPTPPSPQCYIEGFEPSR